MKESGRKLLLYAAKIVPSKCTLQLVIQMTMPKIVDLKTFPTFTPKWRNQTEDSVNVPSKLLTKFPLLHPCSDTTFSQFSRVVKGFL